MLSIYTEQVFPFPSYIEGGLVEIVKNKPQCYATIEKSECACNSKNGIAVKRWCIFIKDPENFVKDHQFYYLNFRSEEETETAIFFLIKSHFQTFGTTLKERVFKHHYSEDFFLIKSMKCGCTEYELKGKPVYCLQSNVVTSEKVGKTFKSVINPSSS